jgi:hypothetical protein
MVKDKYGLDTSEVELDTSGVEEKEVTIEEKKVESKEPVIPKFEVEPDGTAVNEHKDDKIEVVQAEETEVKTEKEDDKKDPQDLNQYSENVKGRIGDLTRNWREAQRREKAALEYAKGIQKKMDDMQKRFPKLEENYLSEFEKRITSDSVDASRALQQAIDSGDSGAIAKANERIVQLSIEKERLANTKYMREQEAEKVKNEPQEPQIPEIQASPKAQAWAEKNEWFMNDNIMTTAALEIDKQIKGEGIAGDTDAYYNELDKRLGEYFPQKFAKPETAGTVVEEPKQEQKKPVQTVASAVRNQDGRRTVKLTRSQLVIAKRLGVPPEEYAKYVK